MKAAIVTEPAQAAPVYADFPAPVAGEGQCLIRVTAAAISHVTKSRASGVHYSARHAFPFIAGVDGVGTNARGERVYFLLPAAPYGALAEFCAVDARHCVALPDALDDGAAAAMAIAGMSSWAALVERARLRPGETVLINGATGSSGRLAVQIAKHLGAGKVIATGRDRAALDALRALGADACVSLSDGDAALQAALQREFSEGVDVVLDYLWGASAEALIVAAARFSPDLRYVQIGAASAPNITLPSAALRSSALQLMGSGIGSVPLPRLLAAIAGVLGAALAARFQVTTRSMALAQVAQAWAIDDARARIVLHP